MNFGVMLLPILRRDMLLSQFLHKHVHYGRSQVVIYLQFIFYCSYILYTCEIDTCAKADEHTLNLKFSFLRLNLYLYQIYFQFFDVELYQVY